MKTDSSPIYISDQLFERSANLLASFASPEPSEGIVYWFGFHLDDRSVITTLMVPNADTHWGCISTSAQSNAEVLRSIVGTPLVLIGQVHSHPGRWVRHSDVDDRQTFPRFEGAISVVVPHFARRGLNLRRCGVHRFVGGAYRMLKTREVPRHLVVIPSERDFRKQEP